MLPVVAVPVPELTAAGIDVRVVDVVRDPRDVLASIRSFTARTGHDGFGRRAGEGEATYVERFATNVAARLDEMLADPGHLVRYEDLVAEPVGTARRLGDWLGAPLDPAAVGPAGEHGTSASAAASVGRWRSDLDAAEAAALVGSLADRLDRLGAPLAG
jgi:hypothetical protein